MNRPINMQRLAGTLAPQPDPYCRSLEGERPREPFSTVAAGPAQAGTGEGAG